MLHIQVQKNIPDSWKKYKTATRFVQSDFTFIIVHVVQPLCWKKRGAKKEVSRPTLNPFLK